MAKKSKHRTKTASNKQSEAQRRRNRKNGRKQLNDNINPDMKIQLEKIGLGLREIPGDG